jgi:predicted kinase
MRGVSGAGKSTKAKSLVENGVIHSTDDLIEKTGDYNGFFSKMVASGDFSELGRMHYQNFKNAIESMNNGVTPVVIDNTNLRQNEPKAYVVAALEMGYADDNIKFVDIGTNGLSADELAKRNTHGVPLEKIKTMINTYKSQGSLTIKNVLESKDLYKKI